MISHGAEISIAGGGADEKDGNRGRSPPLYIKGNPSTAFAARLIPQYESHIHVTKETIQFVLNLTKEIPHSNHVTKERTPKLSQHVSHQETVRVWDGRGGRFRISSAAETDSDSCSFPLPLRFPFSSFRQGELGSEHGRPAGLVCDSAPAVIR